MTDRQLSLIIEPEDLQSIASQSDNLIIVDLCSEPNYMSGHIPGAIHVSPAEIVLGVPPAPGKLPEVERLNSVMTRIGLTPDSHVIAYDDEGGGWAGRFIWTLDVIGHAHSSYLNGGLTAWKQAGLELTTDIPKPAPQPNSVTIHHEPILNKDEILTALAQPNFMVWDARSADEYSGQRQTAQRNGHIPKAVHCEWTELMDQNAGLRIRKDVAAYIEAKGITADKLIATHCHSHHRSGLTYLVGKSLGLNIKAYPGSWSEWGNDPLTPVE
ncbi:hypothetical protein NBRC116494_04320 [Aurantivibrio plasticivorans]